MQNVFKVISCLLSFLILLAHPVSAQSQTGVTGVRDTSYSLFSAYQNTLKTHPDAKLVILQTTKAVSQKKDISYCKVGNRSLLTDVFYPTEKSKKQRPAILIIHGGGW